MEVWKMTLLCNEVVFGFQMLIFEVLHKSFIHRGVQWVPFPQDLLAPNEVQELQDALAELKVTSADEMEAGWWWSKKNFPLFQWFRFFCTGGIP